MKHCVYYLRIGALDDTAMHPLERFDSNAMLTCVAQRLIGAGCIREKPDVSVITVEAYAPVAGTAHFPYCPP